MPNTQTMDDLIRDARQEAAAEVLERVQALITELAVPSRSRSGSRKGAPMSSSDYYAGHRKGYLDAVAEIWNLQNEAAEGSPEARRLGEIADDLRTRYHRVRERQVATDALQS